MSFGYQQSFKGTETTGNNLSRHPNDNNKNTTDLYKDDSVSSDPPVIFINNSKNDDELHQEDLQHKEIKVFMKKADKLNEVSYRKLHEGKALFPESSTVNLYKSSKNIFDDITIPIQRDRQIRSIYLGGEKDKRRSYNSQKRTQQKSLIKRKLTTESKLVQTDFLTEDTQTYKMAESKQGHKTIEPSVKPLPSKLKKTLRAIEEDEDQQFIPVKRKNLNTMFNTITITGEIVRNKLNPDAYLKNVAQVEHDFNKTARRYSLKQQLTQSTFYNASQNNHFKPNTFLQPIINQSSVNPWDNAAVDKKKAKGEEILPIINEKTSGQEESKKNAESNRQTKVQKMQRNKESRKNQYQTSQNSLFVENTASVKKSQFSEGQFAIMGTTNTTNIGGSDVAKEKLESNIKKPIQKSEVFIQVPQVREISIGTDTNNFILSSKKPIHPISIGFSQSSTNWITTQFQPKSQFFKNIDTKNFNIKKYRNGVYFGQLSEEGQKHGRGVVFYFNGRSYEGNFVHDLKEGKGFEYMPDGSVYEGDFRKGLKEGKGVFEWANGEVYDGQWIGGKKNGSGMWKSPRGDTYLGEWKNGAIEGFGVLTIKEGDRYEGQFKNSVKSGLGTQRYSNGDTYVGQFSKNRPNGQGQYYYHNGDIYRGTFSNGLKHGNGVIKTSNGYIYQGQFRNEKKCGYGEQTTGERIIYKGNFQNDLKHGYGQQSTPEGLTTKGYWINGKIVETEMGPIIEDQLDRQQSILNIKTKKNRQNISISHQQQPKQVKKAQKKKSPSRSPKVKKNKNSELSPNDPNFQRTCGCKRKH